MGILTLRSSVVAGGGAGAEWGGRTPTKFVTTSASGSGNGSLGSPWTMTQALTSAVAGDIVGIYEGTYTVTNNPSGNAAYNIPAFNPANSGTSGNPIIFQARWPAIGNYAEALRTKLTNGVTSGSSGVMTFGCTGRDYITWDGPWCDESVSLPTHSGNSWDMGPAGIIGSTGSEIRRCRIDCVRLDRQGTNHQAINVVDADNATVHSNYVRNGRGTDGAGGSVNQCGIQLWWSRGVVVTNNLVDDCNTAIYVKDDNINAGFGGIVIRYNKLTNCDRHIRIHDPSDLSVLINYVQNNLLVTCTDAGIQFNTSGIAASPNRWHVDQNTFIDCAGDGAMWFNFQDAAALADTPILDNLVDGGTQIFRFWDNTTTIATLRSNGLSASYNSVRGTTRYARVSATDYANTNISGFNTDTSLGTGAQAFSTGATIFVDRTGGDYRLAVGSPALTASSTSGPIGCYVTGSETIGLVAA